MTAKELKNALLQEAVQGKLVPQISSEGNARDLMEEIRKEKLSHGFANSYGICGEKGKKSKSSDLRSKSQIRVTKKELPDITEDEIPFEIPENWCWCRLSDIGEINRGRSQHRPRNDISLYENGTIPFIQTGDVAKANGIILEPKTFYNEKGLSQSKLWKKGTICLTIAANIGDVAVLNFDACFPDSVVGFNGYEKVSDNKYVMYTLMWYKDLLGKLSHSTAQKNINLEILSKIVFPLPPLAEQKRIVAAIEKFMPLIEEYGKKETELEAINEQIGSLTKKAILQEAVQGKLVPQIAGEGNAKDLLEEIRKERLSHGLDFANAKSGKRKSKKETALAGSNPCDITEEEIPFEIPESWCWCRLGEICNEIKRGKSPKYADKSNFLAFAQKCNVKTGGIDLGLALYLDEKSITRYSETDNLVQGDIVINSTGGGTMGRVGLYETKVPAGIKGVYPDSHVTVIRSIGNINQHYLYYVLKLNQPVLEKCGTGSTNQTELKPAVLANFVIPLPPLAEQKRIVKAIEKLLPLCEALKV